MRDGWVWPTGGPVAVTRGFDPPAQRWLPGHRGVDLALAPGSSVLSPAAGVVAFAGTVAGVGVVSIDHPNGVRTTFQPVAAVVTEGQAVAAGQPIGTLLPGHENDALHFGARIGKDHYINPLTLLVGRVHLKPWDA